MTSRHQYISRKHEEERVIIFEREDLVFVFNFHWYNSYSDYRVGCLLPGMYKVRFVAHSVQKLRITETTQALVSSVCQM